jgi:putative transcriptional regulator
VAIEVRLDLVLARRKMRLTELSERVDIALTNLSLLKTGKVKAIRFSTLEALCRELDCQPGDLLEYVPEPAAAGKGRAVS